MITQAQEQRSYSPIEYLDQEVQSADRHEYIDGQIVPMTGGTPNHNKIAGNLYAALNIALKREPYEIFVTDQRLWLPQSQIYTYPDIMVMPEPLVYAQGRTDTLINPMLIVEVLSSSTKSYDKDEKFAAYRTQASFQEYVLIDQYAIHLEHYVKTNRNQWLFTEYSAADQTLALSSLAFEIAIADLYHKVNFDAIV